VSGLGSPDRRLMADSIVQFVQSQPALADLVARLAGSGTLRD
jgi:hypothetical protein